jgi:acyl-CoA hydrolase
MELVTTKICDSSKMVTIKIEEVVFKSPVNVENLIKIYASVDKSFAF